MAERVQIILEADDEISGIMRGIVSQFGELGNFASMASDAISKGANAFNLYKQAVDDTSISVEDVTRAEEEAAVASTRLAEAVAAFVIKSLQEAIQETVKYAEEVRQLSLMSNTTAEESSRLIQVFDDFKISAEQLTPIIKAMTKEGLTPNLETIALLADEYNAIEDPIKQNEFLFKNFGRAGADLAEIMSKGGDAIREMGAAVDDSLIMTEQGIEAARRYELAIDNWNDSIQGLKLQAVSLLTPLTALVNLTTSLSAATKDQIKWYEYLLPPIAGVHGLYLMLTEGADNYKATQEAANLVIEGGGKAADDAAYGIESLSEKTARLEEEARLAAEAVKLMTEANSGLLDLTVSIAEENQNYNDKLADEQGKLADLQAEIDNLINQGYSPQSEKVQEVTDKYNDQQAAVEELKVKHQEALASIATDLVIAKMKADGFTDAEYDMAIAMLESTGKIDKAAAQTAIAMDRIAQAASMAGADGAARFGEVISTVMADGVIDAGEMESALLTLGVKSEEASDTVNQAFGNVSTADAQAQVIAVEERLQELTSNPWVIQIETDTSNVTYPNGTTQQQARFDAQQFSGGGTTYNIQNVIIAPDSAMAQDLLAMYG